MKLAMAQMSMTGSMDENLKRSLAFCDAAAGSDLLFFPEVQLIVQELDLAEARLWREQKAPVPQAAAAGVLSVKRTIPRRKSGAGIVSYLYSGHW